MKNILIIITCILFAIFNAYLFVELKEVKKIIGSDNSISEINNLKEEITNLKAEIINLQNKDTELSNEIADLNNYNDNVNSRLINLNSIINNSNKEINKINKWQEKFTDTFKYYVGMANFSKYVYDLENYRLSLKGE